MMRVSTWLVASALILLPHAVPARERAAPHIILFYSGRPSRRIVMRTWRENLELMQAMTATAPRDTAELRRLSYVNVALYWGSPWNAIADTISAERLDPSHASQRGRVYFVADASHAIVVLRGGDAHFLRELPREHWYDMGSAGIAMLTRHGVRGLRSVR
jgi:hypothetical protein